MLLAAGFVLGGWWRVRWAFDNGLWRDEVQFLTIASSPTLRDLAAFLSDHESHPPLYYLLARGWGAIAGWTDAAAYGPSLLFGLLVLVSMGAVAWRQGGRGAGILAVLFGATSATLVIDAGMVRPYAWLSLLVLWSTWLAAEVARGGGLRHAGGWVALALMLVYTHNWTWLVVGAQALLMVLAGSGAPGHRLRRSATMFGLVLVGYLPWLPTLLKQVSQAGYAALPYWEALDWLERALEALIGLPLVVALLPILIALAAVVADRRRPGRRSEQPVHGVFYLAMVAVSVAAAVALLPVTNLLISQCFAMLAPAFLTGLALVLRDLRFGRGLSSAAVQVLWLTASVLQWSVIGGMPKTTVREHAAALARAARPEDLVVVMPVYSAPPFGRYFVGPARVETFPDRGLPMAVFFDRRHERNIRAQAVGELLAVADSAARGGGRVWVVSSDAPAHDLLRGMDSLRAELTARYGPARPLQVDARRPMYESFSISSWAATR